MHDSTYNVTLNIPLIIIICNSHNLHEIASNSIISLSNSKTIITSGARTERQGNKIEKVYFKGVM